MNKTKKNKRKSYYVPVDKHKSHDSRQRLGVAGEDMACRYLEKKGMTVIGRNVRCSLGELDIIAIDGSKIVFIEVKSRKSLKYGRPSLALTKDKQRKVRQLALCYLHEHKEYKSLAPRIDVIEIILGGDEPYINHIKAAF